MGSALKVLKVKRGWIYVQLSEDNYLGWINIDQCIRQTQEQLDQWNNKPRIIVTAAIDSIRNQPSLTAPSVCDVTVGALLGGKEYNKEWSAVSLPDGRNGYLRNTAGMDYHQWKKSRNPRQENIEKSARSVLGVRYLWGGASPKGFDCSGFTKTVFKMNGIALQRDADQQGSAGEDVPLEKNMDQLQKGDLLFFSRKPFSGVEKRITHVAIYLGQKEFIHCSGKVKLNSFDPSSPLYNENLLRRLVKVKRYLPDK
jgi:cell wall-associated NlpC family hydrolase